MTGTVFRGNTGNPMMTNANMGYPQPGYGNTNGMPGMPGAQQQQQGAQQLLAQMVQGLTQTRSLFHNQAKGSSRSGIYNFGNNTGDTFSTLLPGANNDDNMFEQQKMQITYKALQFVNQLIVSLIQRRENGQYLSITNNAIELFRHLKAEANQPTEKVLIDFSNEIKNNVPLYNQIVTDSCLYLAGIITHNGVVHGKDFTNDYRYVTTEYAKAIFIGLIYNFIDFLKENPQGSQLYYNSSPDFQRYIDFYGSQVDKVRETYAYINVPSPFESGVMDKIKQRNDTRNPLFDLTAPGAVDMGRFMYDNSAMSIQAATTVNSGQTPQGLDPNSPMYQYLYRHQLNGQQQPQQPQEEQVRYSALHSGDNVPLTIDDGAPKKINFRQVTRENRLSLDFDEYFTQIGDTEWYYCDRYHWSYIEKTLDHVNPEKYWGPGQSKAWRAITVYKVDWKAGVWDYKIIRIEGDMDSYLSDPQKLLPFLYIENDVLKSRNEPEITVDQHITQEGVKPVEKPRELKEEPKVVFGNKPYLPKDTFEAQQTLILTTKTIDPNDNLDAFILPSVINTAFYMEDEASVLSFRRHFPMLIKGFNRPNIDVFNMIAKIGSSISEYGYEDTEIGSYITGYISQIFNRFLVERRGYSETKDAGGFYYKTDNVFDDIADFAKLVAEHDHETFTVMSSYIDSGLADQFEFILNAVDSHEHFVRTYGKEEDEFIKTTKIANGKKALVFSRETVFINMKHQGYPTLPETIIVKDSVNPEFTNIIRRAIKQTRDMFVNVPQVIFHFHDDPNNNYWIATESGFDENVYTLRPLSKCNEFSTPSL